MKSVETTAHSILQWVTKELERKELPVEEWLCRIKENAGVIHMLTDLDQLIRDLGEMPDITDENDFDMAKYANAVFDRVQVLAGEKQTQTWQVSTTVTTDGVETNSFFNRFNSLPAALRSAANLFETAPLGMRLHITTFTEKSGDLVEEVILKCTK